ncbi:helix-turn-helix transcriptional regulator [Haladaptatus sp. CMSO5]|uniref:helix-turn-helix transcriptional regulator n=1 Tax=Haladaptatus sp. CMSO5 TaxID=3120514 RepID=UPI002FCE49B6
MTTDALDDSKLAGASNVLVLSPLTPAGNDAFLELLTAMSAPAETNIVAITYTQPPETWIADWQRTVGDLPSALTFIHANGANVANDPRGDSAALAATSVLKVDPCDPMDIIAPVTEHLSRWQHTDRQSIVSVQTLSILLEYVDFDTAFRYLHLLTHRVQPSALGFYQMDPEIHDAQTVNTLKSLFDAVVELHDGRWRVVETYAGAGDAAVTDDDEGLFGALNRVITRLSSIGASRAATDDTADATGESASTDAASGERPIDVDLMSASSRICQLLTESGGRMKQTDIANATAWSKSTVSRKLSKLEGEGTITRVRIGRENVVFLAGYEPANMQNAP